MNDHIELRLLTNMHAGRNYMNIISSDVLVFVSVGSPGTLSELAHAIQMKKPSLIIRGTEKLQAYVEELTADTVEFIDTLERLSERLNKLLAT